MRRTLRLALAASVVALGLVASTRDAHAQEGYEETASMAANRGLKLGLGPIVLLPSRSGGPWGGGLDVDVRYGIKAGPTVLAPGGRVSGYVLSERLIGTAMPTFRLTVPIGPLAPFLVGGIGIGGLTNESETGLALLGGGGLMIHLGRILAVGMEVTYQEIHDTEFKSVAIGPAISFGG